MTRIIPARTFGYRGKQLLAGKSVEVSASDARSLVARGSARYDKPAAEPPAEKQPAAAEKDGKKEAGK